MFHRTPGIAAVLVMAAGAVMAHGVPGVSGGAPARQWMDSQIREQVRLDQQVYVSTADVHEYPATIEAVQRSAAGRRARRAGRAHPYRRDFRKIAYQSAKRAGIRRPTLFVRQMAAESGFQPCAKSYAGAIGIAQIMPATARSWQVDPHIPEEALNAAAKHMAVYERQLGNYRLALAAYNAGPGAVRQYGGVPPYAETREYIRRVTDRSYPLRGMTQVFHSPNRMNSRFSTRLHALMRDVRRHGGRIYINDGLRTYQESLVIWRHTKRKRGGWQNATRWAAPPGCSNHVRGYAADLGGSLSLAHQLAGRHGLVFPMSWEPWHIELPGIPARRA